MSAAPTDTPMAGILHTVPALAASFDASIRAALPGVDLVHIVDSWLLESAISGGVTAEVTDRVIRHIRYLEQSGVDAVLVTCSSIGEAVDDASTDASIPVLRVDATMARDAVEIAARAGLADHATRAGGRRGRIAVLATLAATLGPTGRLLESVAADGPEVTAEVIPGAADARANGDQDEHDRLVLSAAMVAAGRADVVVLAQASMAAAIGERALGVPVLTSPTGGVAALVTALQERPMAGGN